MKLPVPVNIITGSLGVGKTTAIQHILSCKPKDEVWAVLVNEFGALGIDGALLQGAPGAADGCGVVIKELAGGCLCCTMSGPLGASLATLIRQAKPDRLLIEPSGLGHPAGLLDVLANPHLRSAVDLRAVLCLVDVTQSQSPEFCGSDTMLDQVNVADVLVGHKADTASLAQVDAFWAFAGELYPPKLQVVLSSRGRLDMALLDARRSAHFTPMVMPSSRRPARHHAAAADAADAAGQSPSAAAAPLLLGSLHIDDMPAGAEDGACAGLGTPPPPPLPGQPQRSEAPVGPAPTHRACGWLFNSSDVFARQRLLDLLLALSPHVARLKGVFRVGVKSWVTPVAAPASAPGGPASPSLVLQPFSHRRDSRLEVIVAVPRRRQEEKEEKQAPVGLAEASSTPPSADAALGGGGAGVGGDSAEAGGLSEEPGPLPSSPVQSSVSPLPSPLVADHGGAAVAGADSSGGVSLAVAAAQRGDWGALEALVLGLLDTEVTV